MLAIACSPRGGIHHSHSPNRADTTPSRPSALTPGLTLLRFTWSDPYRPDSILIPPPPGPPTPMIPTNATLGPPCNARARAQRLSGSGLRRHRMAAGITQETLAHAAGLAPSTVAKLEQGGSVRIETLNKIARALHVKTSQLMAPDTPDPANEDSSRLGLVELRNTLTPPIGLTDPTRQTSEEPYLPALLGVIRNGAAAYDTLGFRALAKRVPKAIRDADSAVCYFDSGEERNRALATRAEAYLLGGRYLTQVRQYDLAHHALSGAIRDAREIGDTNTAAFAISIMSWLLLRQGRLDDAERVAVEAADHVEPRISTAEPERLVVWGWLALAAAAAAVRNNRDDEAGEAGRIAASAASALGVKPVGVQRFAGFDSTVVGAVLLRRHPEHSKRLAAAGRGHA